MNPLIILLFPLAEIATFIVVGKAIGVLATLALVIASSMIGLAMLREAGVATALRLRRRPGDSAAILAQGGARVVAAILLFLPGFLTNLAALAVLSPPVRRWALGRIATIAPNAGGQRPELRPENIIDADFRQLDD